MVGENQLKLVIGMCDIELETGKAYDVVTFYVFKGQWFAYGISNS